LAEPKSSPLRAAFGCLRSCAPLIRVLAEPKSSPLRAAFGCLRSCAPLIRVLAEPKSSPLRAAFGCLRSCAPLIRVLAEPKSSPLRGSLLAVCDATRLSNRRVLCRSLTAIYKKPDVESGFLYMAVDGVFSETSSESPDTGINTGNLALFYLCFLLLL
jgi:hypothetical protein